MRRLQQLMNVNKNKLQIHNVFRYDTFKDPKHITGSVSYLYDLAKEGITTAYVAAIVDNIDVQDIINDVSNLERFEFKNGQWYNCTNDDMEKLEDDVNTWSLGDDDIILKYCTKNIYIITNEID